ncbi:MAG: tetratricopeptide repeat protein, partial [Pyrinomonadaceae bacterium]|nr:tetratricopeptide repeat protein [Pyrinomonadaceae bacterium]
MRANSCLYEAPEVMKMFRLKVSLLALVLLVFSASDAICQQDTDVLQGTSFEITGQVRRSIGKGTIERASVRLDGFAGGLVDQTVTDSNGRFRFSRLRRGQYTVTVKAQGFREEKQQIDINQFLRRAQIFFDLKPDNSETTTRPTSVNEVVDARVPVEARREFEKGRAALDEDKTKQGLSHLEKAINIYPEFLAAHLLVVNTHMRVHEWEKAERALKRVLQISPQIIEALVDLGEVYRRQKRYTEAEQTLQKVVTLDAQSWQAHFTLGRVYWETGDVVKAGKHTGLTLQ